MQDQLLLHLSPSAGSPPKSKDEELSANSSSTLAFTTSPLTASVFAQKCPTSSISSHSKNVSNPSLSVRNSPTQISVSSLPKSKFFPPTQLPKGFCTPLSTDLNDLSYVAPCSLPTSFKDEVTFSSAMLDSPMLVFSPHTVLDEGIPFLANGVPALEAYARKS